MGERKRRLQRLIGKKTWFKKRRKIANKKKVGYKPRSQMSDKEREKELREK